jgi:superfamily II RNA helicase
VGYIVKRECEQIIRKLPNYKEYLNLPEYVQMVSLLEKGVAIHHAGVMPVLRELVEILYSRGYIKLLFATETFSVGLNMPTKTTIFTDISKFDGSSLRQLHAHEYTQMAGRAGRRGIDVVGHVVHLPNLYSSFTLTSFKMMLGNKAQRLESKFRISYNMIFNCMGLTKGTCTVSDICDHVRCSMLEKEVRAEATQMVCSADDAKAEHDKCLVSCAHLKTPVDAVETYIALLEEKPKCVNKRRKEVDRAIQRLTDEHKFIEKDRQTVVKRNQTKVEWDKAKDSANNCQTYIENCIKIVLHLLTRNGYVFEVVPETTNICDIAYSYAFTVKGQYARHFREINCLLFSELYDMKVFDAMDECQIACFFSCFTNVSVPDDKRAARVDPKCSIKTVVDFSSSYLEKVVKEEVENRIKTGVNCEMQIDMIDYVEEWWWAQNEVECKMVLERVKEEKQVSLGEFVKTLIKINNIKDEMVKVAEANGDLTLLNKLVEIPANTLKFVATNQSLYV